ncbi:hypothetical protein [Corynebacterium sp.]|uniref:hypothetical protein n=1 Tax=Corynebacterium sp. TaxID=1720 RepID=UPI0025B9C8F5|nr:hypothetical protein [Corynebacterium sp.]
MAKRYPRGFCDDVVRGVRASVIHRPCKDWALQHISCVVLVVAVKVDQDACAVGDVDGQLAKRHVPDS